MLANVSIKGHSVYCCLAAPSAAAIRSSEATDVIIQIKRNMFDIIVAAPMSAGAVQEAYGWICKPRWYLPNRMLLTFTAASCRNAKKHNVLPGRFKLTCSWSKKSQRVTEAIMIHPGESMSLHKFHTSLPQKLSRYLTQSQKCDTGLRISKSVRLQWMSLKNFTAIHLAVLEISQNRLTIQHTEFAIL